MKEINATHTAIYILLAFAMLAAPAAATIDSDLNNFSAIIGNSTYGLTGFMVNMMSVFLQPPLVYFVTIGIFVTIIGIVAGLIMRRGRRGRR